MTKSTFYSWVRSRGLGLDFHQANQSEIQLLSAIVDSLLLLYLIIIKTNRKEIELYVYSTHCLGISYYVQKLGGGGHRSRWNSAQMNNWHPCQLKKSRCWGPLWSYLLNSTANSTHLPRKWVKGAELVVQFGC